MSKDIFVILLFISHTWLSFAQSSNIDSLREELSRSDLSMDKVANLSFDIGRYYNKKRNYLLALEYSQKALKQFKLNKNKIQTAKVLEQIGNIYSEINDYSTSIKHFLDALQIFEENKKEELAASTMTNISALNLKIAKYDKAFAYLFKTRAFYLRDTNKYKEELIYTHSLLGVTFGSIEKLDSALYYFNKTLLHVSKNSVEFAGLLNNIGAIYSKMDENEKALEHYQEALDIFLLLESKKGIAVSTVNVAFINKKEKNYPVAIPLYKKAIGIFRGIGALHYLMDAYLNLSDIYKEQENYIEALSCHEHYESLKDSVSNTDVLGRVADLEMQYAIHKKNQEIKIVEQENELRRNWQWITIGGFLFVIITIVLILRNLRTSLERKELEQQLLQQEKQQLSRELVLKNKGLEQFALRIVEKNELLEKLKKDVTALDSQTENKKKVKGITANINHNLYLDQDRKELELQIDQAHQLFLDKLSTNFPDLTKTEKRLSSLLMLELSTKDIASVMNIAPDSVKKNRNRLRKKLGLEPRTNLSNFLKNM